MTNYNIDLHVPMIIRSPKQDNRGAQTEAITELIDMFPSLCELAGIEVPDYMQGTSFVPLIHEPHREWKEAAFSQFHRRPKVSADGRRYMGYSMNTKKYHYIEWYTWDAKTGTRGEFVDRELYLRDTDPKETINVAADSNLSSTIDELSKMLAAGWTEARPKVVE
jgi:iduronate 2-sulfatase